MWNLGQSILGGDEAVREDRFFDGDSDAICNLSPLQRIYGFAASLIAGLALMFLIILLVDWRLIPLLSLVSIWCLGAEEQYKKQEQYSFIVFTNSIKFALLFIFGNMLAIGSTAFLMGPTKQLAMMFDPVRLYATIVFLGCVVLALICALWIHSKILTVIAIICEICALIWYSLSYIPFARRMASDMMVRIFDTEI